MWIVGKTFYNTTNDEFHIYGFYPLTWNPCYIYQEWALTLKKWHKEEIEERWIEDLEDRLLFFLTLNDNSFKGQLLSGLQSG